MTVAGNPYRHHTHRLDLEDPSIREWAATVLLADPDQGIVLDRSAFYPGGGGQPPDHGYCCGGMFGLGSLVRGRVTIFICCRPRETHCLQQA